MDRNGDGVQGTNGFGWRKQGPGRNLVGQSFTGYPHRHCFVASLLANDGGESAGCDKFGTTGKSLLLIFGIDVKPKQQKYFALSELRNTLYLPLSVPTRGALRDRHETLGTGCDGRHAVKDE
jgi:hypothetical protein